MSESLKLIKDTTFLSTWNIASALISVFIFYVVTNFLGPVEYGKYALAFAIISTINLSAYVSVNETLLRFSAVTKDKRMLMQCLKLQSFFGILVVAGLSVLSLFVKDIYNKPIGAILFVLALSFLFTPVIESVRSFSIGRKNVKNFVYLTFFNQIMLLIFIATFSFFGMRTAFLFSMAYVAVTFVSFVYAWRIIKKEKFEDDGKYNKKEVADYIKGGIVYGFFKNIYFQSAVFVGSRFVDIANVAYYTFGMSIATASIVSFIQNIQTMTVPYATNFYETKQTERCSKYLNAGVKLGLIVCTGISILLYVILKLVIKQLFPKYVAVITIIPYIFLASVMINFTLPISFLKAKGKMNTLVKISVTSAVFSVISSYTLSKLFGLNGMILSFIVNVLLVSLMAWYYARKELEVKFTIIPTKEEITVFVNYSRLLINKIKNALRLRPKSPD